MKTNETIEEKQIDEEMPAAPDAATEAPLNDAPDDAERRSAELEAMLAASGSLRPAVPEGFRCGYVAVVGRPNVGKSTLINHLIGEKVSITSKKPQTTRNRVLGVVTKPMAQFVFVDTPGFQTKVKTQLTRRMNRSVRSTLAEVDAVVFVIEALGWRPGDLEVLSLLPKDAKNVILAINKTDLSKNRDAMLPLMAESMSRYPFAAIVPVSAERIASSTIFSAKSKSFFRRAFLISIRISSPTSRPASLRLKRFAKRPFACSATNCLMALPSRLTNGRRPMRRRPSLQRSSLSAKATSRL